VNENYYYTYYYITYAMCIIIKKQKFCLSISYFPSFLKNIMAEKPGKFEIDDRAI